MDDSVVVLGGGGIWGVAWMTGVLTGLADRGIDLGRARAFIGTSAGAIVGSQIAHGHSPAELFGYQTRTVVQSREPPPDGSGLARLMTLVRQPWSDPEARTRAIAALALDTRTSGPPPSRDEMGRRLNVPSNEWPERSLSISAVDTASCELCVFNARSGVGLIDAVVASCAVPGLVSPIAIDGRRYMDGGLWRNPENAHLANGARSVVVISPFAAQAQATPQSVHADIDALRRGGTRVMLIAADVEAFATLTPLGPMDPTCPPAAAQAGRSQGQREAEKMSATLGATFRTHSP